MVVALMQILVACKALISRQEIVPACDPDLLGPIGFCVLNRQKYFAYEPPRPWPVKVFVGFYLEKVFHVNLDEGTITFQIFLISKWNDTRLAVILPSVGNDTSYGEFGRIPVSNLFAREVWDPRVVVYNSRVEQAGHCHSSRLW